jgi:hypothetical protein
LPLSRQSRAADTRVTAYRDWIAKVITSDKN